MKRFINWIKNLFKKRAKFSYSNAGDIIITSGLRHYRYFDTMIQREIRKPLFISWRKENE